MRLRIVVIGLTITSSWGNGHATTYRALLKGLALRGHEVTFLECDRPWYARARDLPSAEFCTIQLYQDPADLEARFGPLLRSADAVILGSYLPEGGAVIRLAQATTQGVLAFYDIDTPITLAKLQAGDHEYLEPSLIPAFDLYLSFAGGPVLRTLERDFGARHAAALYCAVDPDAYRPLGQAARYDLGYLGTYSDDRQPALDRLLLDPAGRAPAQRFIVAGPQYPAAIAWPANVARQDHVAPADHPAFYGSLRFALNITRAAMVSAGWSPSVRLFEAAACGVPIISDDWPGLAELFRPGHEILVAPDGAAVLAALTALPEARRRRIAAAARARVLAEHSGRQRAGQLEALLLGARASAASA